MYKIAQAPASTVEIADVVIQQCVQLQQATQLLGKGDALLACCVEINRLENEADRISRYAIGDLFEKEKDPINLIKQKELIEVLETATDKAEDAANALEAVVLKSA